jgi:hypothetical protein
VTRYSATAALLVVLIGTVACNQPDSSRTGTRNSLQMGDPPRLLAIGEIARASITGDEPLICGHMDGQSRSGGPCQRFRVQALRAGVVGIHIKWDNQYPVRLRLTTLGGVELRTICCRSPMDLTAQIDSGGVYEVEVILLTDWGGPERAAFELTASFQHSVS